MKYVIGLIISLYFSAASAANRYDEKEQQFIKKASDLYGRLAPVLAPTNVPFVDMYNDTFQLRDGGILKTSNHMGDTCHVLGQFSFQFEEKSGRLLRVRNVALENYAMTNAIKETCPTLSIEEAVSRAKHYMGIIGVNLPNEMKLKKVTFGSSSWNVFWNSEVNSYAFDNFFDTPPCAGVFFHESFGFIVFSVTLPWPLPKSLKVCVSREEAILKAAKAVPLVMKTPQYLQSRLPGFKAKEVKGAELLISVPNWLLDPARADWLPEHPPKETRLCWVIRFTTADAIPVRPRNFKPIPPDILIYIDSETGEIVGANFT
jgi:hypothetical protein